MKLIKFVEYTGEYPCLCMGELILNIDGEIVVLENALLSGGRIENNNWDLTAVQGPWNVDLPEDLKEYEDHISMLVNNNVLNGCCGGCI